MGFWDRVQEAAATLDEHSYYELLGVGSDASLSDIEERFFALARRFHPDRHVRERDGARQAALTRLYARLNEAARVLGAPDTRKLYDRCLAEGQRRLDPEARPASGPRDTRDPKSPSARSLYEQARSLLEAKNYRAARAKLSLARQLEPDSKAIASAFAEIEAAEKKTRKPTATKARASVEPPETAPAAKVSAKAAVAKAAVAKAAVAKAAVKEKPPASAPPTASSSGGSTAAQAARATGSIAAPMPTDSDAAANQESASPASYSPPRRHPRVALRKTVSITANNWQAVERLVSEDMSKGGTFLGTSAPFPVGTPVSLRIAAPDDSLLQLQATVVWVSDGVQRRPGMGLKFEVPQGKDRAQLDALLNKARAAALPGLEELVETVARAGRLGPAVFELGDTYTAAQLDDAFMPLAMRFDPSRFAPDDPRRAIAEDLAELLRASYQAASRTSQG